MSKKSDNNSTSKSYHSVISTPGNVMTEEAARLEPGMNVGRYLLKAILGKGGMGKVFRALDQEREIDVALKVMKAVSPAALLLFKNEFRAHAHVTHTNLVELHELVAQEGLWYFTMELVDGVDILRYIRGEAIYTEITEFEKSLSDSLLSAGSPPRLAPVNPLDTCDESIEDTIGTLSTDFSTLDSETGFQREYPPLATPKQLDHLRDCLGQLVEGLGEVHRAGLLHCDVKPPNVLVSATGRVVILDFGIVTTISKKDGKSKGRISGTPAYMSPEQAGGLPMSPASDWYGVGVILYQALTGKLPFRGRSKQIMKDKQVQDPDPIEGLPAFLPRDLASLASEMLERNPADRPAGDDILRRLMRSDSAAQSMRDTADPAALAAAGLLFVGRQHHLTVLNEVFASVADGRQRTVFLHGNSGMGKTALIEHFLEQLENQPHTVVLRGRCYERESVPYKALDSLVDALAQHLLALQRESSQALDSLDLGSLARLFPVLRQLIQETDAPAQQDELLDLQELWQKASAALRALLAHLAQSNTLVLYIDDVQWGDADSAHLLNEVVGHAPAPPILLLTSHRTEEAKDSRFLQILWDQIEHTELEVGPLAAAEARALSLALLRHQQADQEIDADRIVSEAGGSPFFVLELSRHLQEQRYLKPGDDATVELTLAKVLQARCGELRPEVRKLLEAIAVAGRPVSQEKIKQVAGLDTGDFRSISILRHRHMVRTQGPRASDLVEMYHDRIREHVVASLDKDALRQYHQRLAEVLKESGARDAEWIALHLEGAGQIDRAVDYLVQAAENAADMLAFDRAAALYQHALELKPPATGDIALPSALAESLANADRGAEAAAVYLEAAKEAGQQERFVLQRLAAEQFLRSGHIDEGIRNLRVVLGTSGIRYPKTLAATLAAVGWARMRVRLRGERYRQRDAATLSARQLQQLDLSAIAATTLGICDTLRGAYFSARHQLLCLASGDLPRIGRAYATEALFSCLWGPAGRRRAERLIGKSRAIAEQIQVPSVFGDAEFAAALTHYQAGQWAQARDAATRATDIFRNQCRGRAHEINAVSMIRLWCLWCMGDIAQFATETPELVVEGKRRGDLYLASDFGNGLLNLAWLCRDDLAGAEKNAEEARQRWAPQGYLLQHYWNLLTAAHIALYRDQPQQAFEMLEADWSKFWWSTQRKISQVNIEALYLRARCAMAAAAHGIERERALKVLAWVAKKLSRNPEPSARPISDATQAALSALRGDKTRAIETMLAAAQGFDDGAQKLFAAAARFRAGKWMDGAQGEELWQRAERWMANAQVGRPDRMAALLVPDIP